MNHPIKIAHISDLHLGPLPAFTSRHWNAKRVLGYINWQRKRRHLHRPSAWQAIVTDLVAQSPDHIAVTGDLVNIALPAEYEAALRWLEDLGSPEHVSLVPGNHDIYTRLGSDPGIDRWQAYMAGAANSSTASAAGSEFPYQRDLGPVRIIGVNSAEPTPPGRAHGRVGIAQLQRLRRALTEAGQAKRFRCVLIHHPPLPGQSPSARALVDADALRTVFIECGVELVLHGHEHRDMATTLETRDGPSVVVGVGSASMCRAYHDEPAARSAFHTIGATATGWQVVIDRRGLDAERGAVVAISSETFTLQRTVQRLET